MWRHAAALLAILAATIVAPRTAVAWNYRRGGSNWGGLCATGLSSQSPIDITNPAGEGGADSEELIFSYPIINAWDAGLRIAHNGKAIVLTGNSTLGYLIANDHKYFVSEIKFHGPSEHRLRGESFPLEMQIVHQLNSIDTTPASAKKKRNSYFIVSVLFRQTNITNRWLDSKLQWFSLPAQKSERFLLDGPFQLGEGVVGLHQGYYLYQGSLNEPPCSPGVTWAVMESIQDINARQVATFNALFQANVAFAGGHGNNRDLLPAGSRKAILHNHKAVGDGDGRTPPPPPDSAEDENMNNAGFENSPKDEDFTFKPIAYRANLPMLYARAGADWTGACRYGRLQSPIDIKLRDGNPHGDFEMTTNYDLFMGATVTNNGATISVRGHFGTLTIQSMSYDAEEITFHSPSEHTVDGRRSPLEMQMIHHKTVFGNDRVHVVKHKDYAILSVLFYEALPGDSLFLNSLEWGSLPPKGVSKQLRQPVDLYSLKGLRNNEGGYYSYAGSLSRPPCSEGVKRFVLRTYQPASPRQIKMFRSFYEGNNRALQSSFGRGVVVHSVNLFPEVLPLPRESLADGSLLPL